MGPHHIRPMVVADHPSRFHVPPRSAQCAFETSRKGLEVSQLVAGPDSVDMVTDAGIAHLDVLHFLESIGQDVQTVPPTLQRFEDINRSFHQVGLVRPSADIFLPHEFRCAQAIHPHPFEGPPKPGGPQNGLGHLAGQIQVPTRLVFPLIHGIERIKIGHPFGLQVRIDEQSLRSPGCAQSPQSGRGRESHDFAMIQSNAEAAKVVKMALHK